MFDRLPIEIAMWHTIGDFLEGSGWTTIFSNAGIVSQGTAASCANFLAFIHCVLIVSLTDQPIVICHDQDKLVINIRDELFIFLCTHQQLMFKLFLP